MDVTFAHRTKREIKYGLVFFCTLLGLGCVRTDTVAIEQIIYEDEKAVGLRFTTETDVEKIRVFVGEESQTSVIGVIVSDKNLHNFTPIVAFTPGQTYTLRKRNTEVLASFMIPRPEKTETVKIEDIYPKTDTVPENLLKMYFEFSEPMQAVGNALDYISVTNMTDGREVRPFLRLESELWNSGQTVLTLWLDPGRIKTDLIPNKEKGLPLTAGNTYRITVDSSWKSRQGIPLERTYTKLLTVGPRDDLKPNIATWKVELQEGEDGKKLYVDFGEPLDAFLAQETIRIYDGNEVEVKGIFELVHKGSGVLFKPLNNFNSGSYVLKIHSKLEDLAGNNLNRLFDTKVKKDPGQKAPKTVFRIPFHVR